MHSTLYAQYTVRPQFSWPATRGESQTARELELAHCDRLGLSLTTVKLTTSMRRDCNQQVTSRRTMQLNEPVLHSTGAKGTQENQAKIRNPKWRLGLSQICFFLAGYSIWASMSEPHLIVLTCESHTVVVESGIDRWLHTINLTHHTTYENHTWRHSLPTHFFWHHAMPLSTSLELYQNDPEKVSNVQKTNKQDQEGSAESYADMIIYTTDGFYSIFHYGNWRALSHYATCITWSFCPPVSMVRDARESIYWPSQAGANNVLPQTSYNYCHLWANTFDTSFSLWWLKCMQFAHAHPTMSCIHLVYNSEHFSLLFL